MSKKRGLSLEEKREKMLQIFYDSQDFYLLKELEKLGPKKGVISQSVKDVIQSLVDDDLVLKDKVGSSIYFWSLPSTAGNQLRSVHQKLDSESQNCKKRFSELQGQCNALKKGRENSDEREEALSKLKSLEKKYNELKDEIKQYADNDPAAFEAMKESINAAYAAANRWTDNIFTLRQWCSNNFPQAKEQLENLYTEAGITDDFDYLELPHLGSLGKASNQIVEVNKAWPSSPSHPFTSSMHSSFRIVVVGDIHEDWELEHDYKALKCLEPELVLFTGDFGNENVELVRSIEKVNMPKAAILGNHDSWSTSKFSSKMKDGVQLQLESLGEAHVGYGRLDLPTLKLSVVGGRPFSCGGDQLFRKKLLKKGYGVKTMEESAQKIHMAAMGTPQDHSIIFLSHNGPTGLGSSADDICGKDWEGGGDHGDPDLAQAISLVQETSHYSIPLVVFGHMHKEMLEGGFRKMISIASNSTTYLNGAIVPRVKPLDSGGSIRAFTVLHLSGGRVTKAVETWVSVVDDNTSIEEEHLLFSEGSSLVESV